MSKIAQEIGALALSRITDPGEHCVGGVVGLKLQINGNSKSWILRAVIGGKRRRIGLGSYPSVTLSQAREKARQAHELIRQGIDPISEKKKAAIDLKKQNNQVLTFGLASEQYIEAKAPEWKNKKHRQQWENTLQKYAFPFIGNMPIDEIDQVHILQILEPIWLEKTETATRLRGRIESVLDWAISRRLRPAYNPARWKGELNNILAEPGKLKRLKRRNYPAVPYTRVPQAIHDIVNVKGITAKALFFTVLTVARSSEVFYAQWSEIDFNRGLWKIPKERMKSHRPHRAPLSDQAIKLLKSVPKVPGCDYIFSVRNKKPLSNMCMVQLMRRLDLKAENGETAVPHGFRSAFRDWAADCTNIPGDVAEMALAHVIENETEAAYRRGDMLDKRKDLMQKWADHCCSLISS